MSGVREFHRARRGLVTRDGDRQRGRDGGGELVRLVTRRAPGRRGLLMVADGAPTRRLERQVAPGRRRLMTDEARDLCVPRVGKRVGLDGWWP